ncbi:thiosulfate oxidation carrier complex protein SoxZ [Halomonas sp. 328]|uniref:thiosulfate oxidation carrier complex protein SoxZ n=1 Tax=Halomonas sp. 328 TaxID=2776704 RepID=UPI0018A6EA82|nr:thiosulfate oxidation carrier complex protein SoxZ [Halomonas sp. 328]MBF8223119.1 thiosulfate oxidation carrier complex protein SoxZ [Halomonas sp. 328]
MSYPSPLTTRLALAGALLFTAPPLLASDAWQRLEPARALVGDAVPEGDGLVLELPHVSEDGSAVPLTVRFEPVLEDDAIASIHLFATGNPYPEVAGFHFTEQAARPEVSTRVRLNESQRVVAVAVSREGRVWTSEREVRVTVSGCLIRGDEETPEALANPRVSLPDFRAGEPGEVRTLITHPMETGLREGPDGEVLPRYIIETFRVSLDGETAFEAELHPSVSANPYLRFYLTPQAEGEALFEWQDDSGERAEYRAELTLS